jgi:hypothetical protein
LKPVREECLQGAFPVQIEYLNEPVKVRADFEGGRTRPLLFKRAGRVYRVERLAASWADRECSYGESSSGEKGARVFYFSVESEGAVYQLSWHVLDNLWYVDAVMMEG